MYKNLFLSIVSIKKNGQVIYRRNEENITCGKNSANDVKSTNGGAKNERIYKKKE